MISGYLSHKEDWDKKFEEGWRPPIEKLHCLHSKLGTIESYREKFKNAAEPVAEGSLLEITAAWAIWNESRPAKLKNDGQIHVFKYDFKSGEFSSYIKTFYYSKKSILNPTKDYRGGLPVDGITVKRLGQFEFDAQYAYMYILKDKDFYKHQAHFLKCCNSTNQRLLKKGKKVLLHDGVLLFTGRSNTNRVLETEDES